MSREQPWSNFNDKVLRLHILDKKSPLEISESLGVKYYTVQSVISRYRVRAYIKFKGAKSAYKLLEAAVNPKKDYAQVAKEFGVSEILVKNFHEDARVIVAYIRKFQMDGKI